MHVLQLRVALVWVVVLSFATQGRAALRRLIVFCNLVALVCVVLCNSWLRCINFLRFATRGCAGLRSLIKFCNSGSRWSAYSYCVSQLRVALDALVCVVLLCLATQGCACLRNLIVFCNTKEAPRIVLDVSSVIKCRIYIVSASQVLLRAPPAVLDVSKTQTHKNTTTQT